MSELAVAEVTTRAVAARPLLNRAILQQETEQRNLLGEYVKTNMVENTDYGVIPGTKNRTLLKPGAEKLIDLFRCTPEYEFIEKIEDFDKPMFHYLIHCKVVSRESGVVIAEGFGSCNSREGKYRWRMEDRKCPKCGMPAIKKSKFPPREDPTADPGWYCHAKASGCGANFSSGDQTIEAQSQGRVENDDVATVVNTILKMAKKRAAVDAAISLARCSDMFTQDAEDFEGQPPTNGTTNGTPAKKQSPPKESPPDRELVEEQLRLLDECTNKSEVDDLVKALKNHKQKDKFTDEGKRVINEACVEARKKLPTAKTINREPGDEPPEARNGGKLAEGEVPY